MNVLFINPEYPDTFWSYRHAIKFISKRAAHPPLGLLTIASMLPASWNLKLTDLNVSKLSENDIRKSDYVFIGAMSVQQNSAIQVIAKCNELHTPIVAGGPLFTEETERFSTVDHLILNEAEITLPGFIDDLSRGEAKRIYQTESYADITTTPPPDYSLLNLSRYVSLSIQYSRGCPFDCEFCDITALLGHKVRTKTTAQIIHELDNLFQAGWRSGVFFVDDNFIGNKKKLKNELLPEIIKWMHDHRYPFHFTTEASINLSNDEDLMVQMARAGFGRVFVGIESPDPACLTECNKVQNYNIDLIESVRAIQSKGMEVCGGFIIGFDHDNESVFDRQIDFIQKSGIVTAMVGLLNAPKKTKLYERLKKEGRITGTFDGDNTNFSMNFLPRMDKDKLIQGYHQVLRGIYSGKAYYTRVRTYLAHFKPSPEGRNSLTLVSIMALLKSFVIIGLLNKNRKYYWQLIFWSIFRKPSVFPLAVTYSILGYHYGRIYEVK